MICDKPPFGWECTRDEGHEGPCAAIEAAPTPKWSLDVGANLNHWTLLPTIVIHNIEGVIVSLEWLCWYVEVWL